jgi:hypothetical protein
MTSFNARKRAYQAGYIIAVALGLSAAAAVGFFAIVLGVVVP